MYTFNAKWWPRGGVGSFPEREKWSPFSKGKILWSTVVVKVSLCTAVPFLFVRRLEVTHSAFLREYKIKVDGQLRGYNHSWFSFSKKATSLLNDPFSLALTSMFPLTTVRNAVHVVYSNAHALSRSAGGQSVRQCSGARGGPTTPIAPGTCFVYLWSTDLWHHIRLQSCCSVFARSTKMDARCYLVFSLF